MTNRSRCGVWGLAALVAVAWIVGPSDARAIVGGRAPDPSDTRFDAVAALGGATLPTSSTSWRCTATLVAPDIVLTAGHCVIDPAAESWLRFRRHPDGSLGTLALGPSSFYHARIAEWTELPGDVAVGRLDAPVTHIEPIGVLLRGTDQLERDAPILHAGWGKEGPGLNEGPRRELLLCDNSIISASAGSLSYRSFMGHECGVNTNDSGSPVLLEDPSGALRVAAVVWTTVSATNVSQYADDPAFPVTHTPFSGVDLHGCGTTHDPVVAAGGDTVVTVCVGRSGTEPLADGAAALRLTIAASAGGAEPVAEVVADVPGFAEDTILLPLSVSVAADAAMGAYSIEIAIDPDERLVEAIEHNQRRVQDDPVGIAPVVVEHAAIYLVRALESPSSVSGFGFVYERHVPSAAVVFGSGEVTFVELEAAVEAGSVSLAGATGAPALDLVLDDPLTGSLAGADVTIDGLRVPRHGTSAHAAGFYYGQVADDPDRTVVAILAPSGLAQFGWIDLDGERDAVAAMTGDGRAWSTPAAFGEGVDVELFVDERGDLALIGQWDRAGTSFDVELVREGTPAGSGEPCTEHRACTVGTGRADASCRFDGSGGRCFVPCVTDADCGDSTCDVASGGCLPPPAIVPWGEPSLPSEPGPIVDPITPEPVPVRDVGDAPPSGCAVAPGALPGSKALPLLLVVGLAAAWRRRYPPRRPARGRLRLYSRS